MKKWKLWLAVLLIFLSGSLVGTVATGLYVRSKVLCIVQEGPSAVTQLVTRRLARNLDLSATQRTDVSRIIQETQQQLQVLRLRSRPEARQIIIDCITEIKTTLTPQQQQELDVLFERFKNRWRSADSAFFSTDPDDKPRG